MKDSTSTIVVVDDDASVLELVSHSIRRLGFEVSSHANPAEALAVLKSSDQVAALVSDFDMPGMSGAELGVLAKKLHPASVVLIFSGVCPPDMVPRSWDAWLLKGAHMSELTRQLQELVRPGVRMKGNECNHRTFIA